MLDKNNAIWILVADASQARLFATEKIYGKWQLLQNFASPQSRKHDSDLISSKSGNYRKKGSSQSSAYSEDTDPKEVVIERFAHQLAEHLNKNCKRKAFQQLILIAAPKFLGLINEYADKKVAMLTIQQIKKDYTELSMTAVKEKIRALLP